jgi:hypothetical protein
MDEELQQLAERLRRGREKIEKALSETFTERTDDIVKKIAELRERIEKRIEDSKE